MGLLNRNKDKTVVAPRREPTLEERLLRARAARQGAEAVIDSGLSALAVAATQFTDVRIAANEEINRLAGVLRAAETEGAETQQVHSSVDGVLTERRA